MRDSNGSTVVKSRLQQRQDKTPVSKTAWQ